MANPKARRENERKQRIREQQEIARDRITRQNHLKTAVNERLHKIKDEEGAAALKGQDITILHNRANFDALIDELCASGVLDRTKYNIRRFETILAGLIKRAESRTEAQ